MSFWWQAVYIWEQLIHWWRTAGFVSHAIFSKLHIYLIASSTARPQKKTQNMQRAQQNPENLVFFLTLRPTRLLTSYWSMQSLANRLRLRSHRHECESEYPYTGSSKHEFACISTAAVHIDTSSVRVRVTFELHSYEQFLRRLCFYPTSMKWTTQNLH